MTRAKTTLIPSILAVLVVMIATPASAGKKSYVGAKAVRGRAVSMDKIDHSAWNGLLQKYVDQDGMVNYRQWRSSAGDQQQLNRYLSALSTANPTIPATREAQLAFWINAYNAVTVSGILKEYPTTSIRNHTAKVVGYNIWHDYQLYVGGTPHSLDTMEHKILRKMSEPRIHFAIVCASIGCPRLLNEAYVANRIDEQLELNAKDFFSRPQNFKYDASRNQFQLSSILSWFGEDFGSNQKAQLRRIANWLPTKAAQQAAIRGSVSVSFQDYNWNLNEQNSGPVARR